MVNEGMAIGKVLRAWDEQGLEGSLKKGAQGWCCCWGGRKQVNDIAFQRQRMLFFFRAWKSSICMAAAIILVACTMQWAEPHTHDRAFQGGTRLGPIGAGRGEDHAETQN